MMQPDLDTTRSGRVRGTDRTSRGSFARHASRDLAQAIEGEIIPRLLLAHSSHSAGHAEGTVAGLDVTPIDVARLAELVVTEETEVALKMVLNLRDHGCPLEQLLLDLLAPAARLLGELWSEDLCTFTDVTIGLSRLHRILHALGPDLEGGLDIGRADHRILLLPVRGEQHTFGLVMLEDFFRRSGWDVRGPDATRAHDAERMVKREWFDIVGISASSEIMLEPLTLQIRAVRISSKNKKLIVMVGGAIFINQPSLVNKVGADFTAMDARDAVLRANVAVWDHAVRN